MDWNQILHTYETLQCVGADSGESAGVSKAPVAPNVVRPASVCFSNHFAFSEYKETTQTQNKKETIQNKYTPE